MRVYVAGPLFTQAEREFSEKIKDKISKEGLTVFLPQEDCMQDIFKCCIENLDRSDAVLAVLEGPQVDDGTAFECGYAFARKIPVVGLRTDFRRVGEFTNELNAMFECCAAVCKSIEEAAEALGKAGVN